MGRYSAIIIKPYITLAMVNLPLATTALCIKLHYSKQRSVCMLVYVLNKYGQPLMPTSRCGKVKHLLNKGLAKVIKRCPFTIQLLYNSNNYTQPISLGIDAGSKVIGVSATTETEELYAAEVELRNDIVDLISTKRELRRSRRNRKTRYRKPRFNNRKNQKDGWLAPSVQHKINTHIRVVDDVCKILPITKITVEVASFDIQKIKNPDIQGVGYQQGEQLDFWNTREYVLFRDDHTCQCCKGKSKDPRLNVHHIESRKTGGDAPNNLITLCETCHKAYHQGKIKLPKRIKRGMVFRDATFMGIMRWEFYNQLKAKYGDIVFMTFGYITKHTRIENNLTKTHYSDARCISGNANAETLGYYYQQKKVRNHNRSLHKSTILKGGIRKSNQAPKYVYGYQLFDKVLYNGMECYIFGRRSSGGFDLRLIDGTKVSAWAGYKKLKLLECRKTILTQRRMQGGIV